MCVCDALSLPPAPSPPSLSLPLWIGTSFPLCVCPLSVCEFSLSLCVEASSLSCTRPHLSPSLPLSTSMSCPMPTMGTSFPLCIDTYMLVAFLNPMLCVTPRNRGLSHSTQCMCACICVSLSHSHPGQGGSTFARMMLGTFYSLALCLFVYLSVSLSLSLIHSRSPR